MKTQDVKVGTSYDTKGGNKFIPLTKSDWKTGSWDGAMEVPNWSNGERELVWAPGFAVHSSQLLGETAVREAAAREAEAAREAARIAARHEARLEAEELADEFRDEVEVFKLLFGEGVSVRKTYSHKAGSHEDVVAVDLGWHDYATIAIWHARLAKELGRLPSVVARSTAMVEPMLAVAAGLTPEMTGFTELFRLEDVDEIAAFYQVALRSIEEDGF